MTFTSNNRTSIDYKMTVKMIDGKVHPNDAAMVSEIRALVKNHNSLYRKYKLDGAKYVKLQGRGPRAHNGRRYNQGLPLPYAVTADVYVYNR